MKTKTYPTKEDWFDGRIGKITGSRLKDIVVKRGTGKKIGYYELIAERIALPASEENPMDRGTRLEEEALARFENETGKEVDTSLVIWERDDCESIAISPDGFIGETEAVEVKCLSSARHIEALLTKDIPDEYHYQRLQYFIVNEKLEKLYWVFYDPRIPKKDFFFFTFFREDYAEEIQYALDYQKQTLEEVEKIVAELTF